MKRRLVIVAVAALAIAGSVAAVAVAAKGPPAGRHGSDRLAAASTYLGVSVTELRADFQAGKTLADVAKATPGKTVDGLVAAIVAAEKAERPNADVTLLTQRVTDFVNGTRPAGRGPGAGAGVCRAP